MGKTVTIPSHPLDRDDCVNDGEILTLKFVEAGDLETSGDKGGFNLPLDSCHVPNPGTKQYTAVTVGAKVHWQFLEAGKVVDKGKITIRHNDPACRD